MTFGNRMENNFETIDISTLLPQQPPFIMVDRLVHFDPQLTVTRFQVRADNLFVEDQRLDPCGLIENIAQTCAARMGYINKYIYKNPMKLGFIGGIKNLTVSRAVLCDEVLTTSIEVLHEVMQLLLVKATVRVGDETIVTAEMQIALSDIDAKDAGDEKPN